MIKELFFMAVLLAAYAHTEAAPEEKPPVILPSAGVPVQVAASEDVAPGDGDDLTPEASAWGGWGRGYGGGWGRGYGGWGGRGYGHGGGWGGGWGGGYGGYRRGGYWG